MLSLKIMKLNPAKSRFSLLFIALFTLVVSCVKHETPDPDMQFPFSVKATAVASKGNVRLFTQGGEVTDESVIARFIADAEGFNAKFEVAPTDIVTFHTDSTAEFKALTGVIKVAVPTSNKLAFRYPFTLDKIQPSMWQPLLDHQLIAKTNITHTVPTATGFTHVGEVVQIASGDYQSFELPATVYKLSRWVGQGDAGASSYINSGVFSPFNEDFLETLRPRDTIAFQEGSLRFTK